MKNLFLLVISLLSINSYSQETRSIDFFEQNIISNNIVPMKDVSYNYHTDHRILIWLDDTNNVKNYSHTVVDSLGFYFIKTFNIRDVLYRIYRKCDNGLVLEIKESDHIEIRLEWYEDYTRSAISYLTPCGF